MKHLFLAGAQLATSMHQAVTKDADLRALNENYAYIVWGAGDGIYEFSSGRLLSEGVVRRMWSNRGKLLKRWMNWPQRRTFTNVYFHPTQQRVGEYNLWKGFNSRIKPSESDDPCPLILRHFREVICGGDEQQYEYWMNYWAQKPQEKPEVALVMQGLPGTGKSMVMDHILRHYWHCLLYTSPSPRD